MKEKAVIGRMKLSSVGVPKRTLPRVLVVQDDDNARATMVALLSEYYEVCSASSDAEALRMLAQRTCDVVCADFEIPLLNGHELLRRVGALPGPVGRVLITAYSDYAEHHEAIHRSVGVVLKPVDRRRLLTVVERVWQSAHLRRHIVGVPMKRRGARSRDEGSRGQLESPAAEDFLLGGALRCLRR